MGTVLVALALLTGANSAQADLYRVDLDGSDLVRLTTGAPNPSAPAYSPDGSKIVFADALNYGIYQVDSDGTDLTLLDQTAYGLEPVFAPAGDRIFFIGGAESYDVYAMDSDGSDPELLIDMDGNWEATPSLSGDGTKLAFSGWDPDTGLTHFYVANPSGTGITEVPVDDPATIEQRAPDLSPNGAKVVWSRFEWLKTGGFQTNVHVANITGSGQARLTGPAAGTWMEPEFSPDGTKLAVTSHDGDNTNIFLMDPDGTDVEQITDLVGYSGEPAFTPDGKQLLFTRTSLSDDELLDAFAPVLKYDSQETYRADSAATITDNYVTSSHSNSLTRGSTVLATADPATAYPTLGLDYLDYPLYADSSTALATDNIDEDNGDYAGDAARLHGDPAYADRTYGRVVRDPGSGETILQYWVFYYYNPKTYLTLGAHEGDWEMVQVHLDSADAPIKVTAAQHGWGERCEWEHVQLEDDTHPIMYVAEGSHASYFSSGYHLNPDPAFPHGPANDTAGGDGDVVSPTIEDVTDPPPWMLWPGAWGGSNPSPPAPPHQGPKWSDPHEWSEEVKGCTEEQLARRAPREDSPDTPPAAPDLPRITARRVGDQVLFRYAFPASRAAGKPEPWMLLTTVDSQGDKHPPLTKRTIVRRRTGTITQSLGLGRPPYRLLVSVRAPGGERSDVVTVPLTR